MKKKISILVIIIIFKILMYNYYIKKFKFIINEKNYMYEIFVFRIYVNNILGRG